MKTFGVETIRIFYQDKKAGKGENYELEMDLAIIKRCGDWCLHRNIAWETERSWFTGRLAPISFTVQPKQHNRKCKEFADLQYANTVKDWENPPSDKSLHSKFYEDRNQALNDCLNTFRPVDICYSVTLFQTGLGWPFKFSLDSKTSGIRAIEALDRIIPPGLTSSLVPIWYKSNSFPGNIAKMLRKIKEYIDDVAFDKLFDEERENDLRFQMLQEIEVAQQCQE